MSIKYKKNFLKIIYVLNFGVPCIWGDILILLLWYGLLASVYNNVYLAKVNLLLVSEGG